MHMLDKAFLDPPPVLEVEVKVEGCRLDGIMSEAILDICDGVAAMEQMHSTGMAEAVNGVDGCSSVPPPESYPTRPGGNTPYDVS